MLTEQKELNKALGHSLKLARESCALPQRLAAKKLGVTHTFLSAIENGRVTTSIELVCLAERVYGKKVLRVE